MNSAKTAPMRLYSSQQLHLYVFVSALFVMGVIFGALMVNALSLEQKQDLSRYLGSFFRTVSLGGDNAPGATLMQTFGMYFKWIMLLWVLGVSVVGVPLILVLDFLKGMLVGFTVGVLISQYAWKGLLIAFVSVAPQNIVAVPVMLICSAAGISFSVYLVKHRFLQKTNGSAAPAFISYTSLALTLIAIMFAVSLFETYITPHMIGWVAPSLIDVSSAAHIAGATVDLPVLSTYNGNK